MAFAIGILVIALAYQTLSTAISGSEVTQEVLAEVDDISRAMYLLETDFRHVVDRDTQLFNVVIPAGFSTESDNDYLLKFVRGGRPNPANLVRSSLLQVGYRLEDETIYRETWPETQDAAVEDATQLPLLTGVTELLFRFLPPDADNREGPWSDGWPEPGGPEELPVAVEVEIEHEEFGRITRLFLLGGG